MKNLLLCIIFFCVWKSTCKEEFDTNKCDYCKASKLKTKKPNKGNHPACRCETEKFRQLLLDVPNELRNHVAGGDETKIETQFAAGMMVLNWDTETPYYARCRAMGSLVKENLSDFDPHEPCSMTQNGGTYAQNYAWNSWYNPKEKPKQEIILELIVGMWYDKKSEKVVMSPTFFEKFDSNPATNEPIQRMSQETRVRCVIVEFAVEEPKSELNLLCDYHSGLVKYGGNEMGTYIYKQADSIDRTCTPSDSNTSCDKKSKYPYLCRKLQIIPTFRSILYFR